MGLLLFGLSVIEPLSLETLRGYVLASFYMLGPLMTVTDTWPIFARGQVALPKVEELQLSLAVGDGIAMSTAAPSPLG